jgi:hypothetical protein
MEYLAKSVKYVNGEAEETNLPHSGSCSIGMKMPLMKTNGNFINEESIMTVDGLSVGG